MNSLADRRYFRGIQVLFGLERWLSVRALTALPKGPGLISCTYVAAPLPSVTPVPEDLEEASPGLLRHCMHMVYRQNIHIHKNKFLKIESNNMLPLFSRSSPSGAIIQCEYSLPDACESLEEVP